MKVKIEGNKQNVHNCVDCGQPLTKQEYYACFDRCNHCKNKYYDSGSADYTYVNGFNKVDNILIDKFRVKEI